MKLYLLWAYEYEGELLGVFSTKEKADEQYNRIRDMWSCGVIETELDSPKFVNELIQHLEEEG